MPRERTCTMTRSGAGTGAAARRGHDDMRRGHRRIHPGDATAHWATAAHPPATMTPLCACLADVSHRARNGSTFGGAACEREARCAQHRLHTS
eukprot:scaffold5918_cov124-Isochrysis_galbana.AAC.12